jgi:BirA family biotin operon repressor/biotin-[acetyl-CoA-carboxylase] ligase
LETHYIETIDSTQIFLENALKSGKLNAPICLWTLDQTGGIGSRSNKWQGLKGNLALSFAIKAQALPNDLPLQSASLYFGFLFKDALKQLGSAVWMKWPNDLYLDDKKIGGVITKRFDDHLLCGIGLNIIAPAERFGAVEINVKPSKLLGVFLRRVERAEAWDAIFSTLAIEYDLSQPFEAHIGGQSVSLANTRLDRDGSVIINGERVYSKR